MALAQVTAGNRIVTTDANQFYSLLKGVSGSGESITLIYNNTGSLIFQPSSDPAAGTELVQIKNNAGTVQGALSSDGKVFAGDGTPSTPAFTYESEKSSGQYRIGSKILGWSINQSEAMRLNASTLNLASGWQFRENGNLVMPLTNVGDIQYSVSAGVAARLAIGTDAQVLTVQSSVPTWLTPASGAVVKLGTTTVISSVASIVFSPIAGFTNLRVVWDARSAAAAVADNIWVRFNGDSGSNYDYQTLNGQASSATAAETFGASRLIVGQVPAASDAAGLSGSGTVAIANYRGAIFNKNASAVSNRKIGTSSGNLGTNVYTGAWRNTAAITSLTFGVDSGNIDIGSVITVYQET